jgi:hypothetical protein
MGDKSQAFEHLDGLPPLPLGHKDVDIDLRPPFTGIEPGAE